MYRFGAGVIDLKNVFEGRKEGEASNGISWKMNRLR